MFQLILFHINQKKHVHKIKVYYLSLFPKIFWYCKFHL